MKEQSTVFGEETSLNRDKPGWGGTILPEILEKEQEFHGGKPLWCSFYKREHTIHPEFAYRRIQSPFETLDGAGETRFTERQRKRFF